MPPVEFLQGPGLLCGAYLPGADVPSDGLQVLRRYACQGFKDRDERWGRLWSGLMSAT